jgi:GNAT superfamily N-acetyltransferase
LLIRLAEPSDAQGIARVHVDSWRTTYRGIVPDSVLAGLSYEQREQYWYSVLTSPTETLQWIHVAEDEAGQVVGFACGGTERENDPDYKGELYAIYLLASYQKQGIGRTLTYTIAQDLLDAGIQSMLVWVLAQNPSRAFYESLGGQFLRDKAITIGGVTLTEVAYGWRDLNSLINLAA